MKAKTENGNLLVGIPKKYKRPNGDIDHSYHLKTDKIHFEDGWKMIVTPILKPNELLGELYERENDFTYKILQRSLEEIKQEALNIAQSEQFEALQNKLLNQAKTTVQALTDPKTILENQKAFDIWDLIEPETMLEIGYKCQDYDGKELKLYQTKQRHEKRADRKPSSTPALFDPITFGAGGIEIWKQPDGASKKYPHIDPLTGKPYRVIYENKIWENQHKNASNLNDPNTLNVWIPGQFGWVLIGPA